MQIASRNLTYNIHSPKNLPQITVKAGEEFLAETELCSGGWLLTPEDSWTPDKTCALNPTVCISVDEAKPGDMLAVEVLDIVPDKIGYTGFSKNTNPLVDKILLRDWGINAKTVEIESGHINWNESRKLPIRPMIGTIGTAPGKKALSNSMGGRHGGNMDVQEVCKGSTVYLPVEVEGALLHIGDVHALQGDGEINGAGGIECRSVVKLRARTMKRPKEYRCVRIENEQYIMTVSCERMLEDSFYIAAEQLLQWIVERYTFSIGEAYLLMGQVMESRSTQMVNPTRSYICKMPKQYLQD